uniref:HD domain-containing protein n=1 Tax=uncultured Alphaproteobacteria bacterium TaxID=91750 RepID=A0A6G8F2V1_9PROT|nr:hypothetical protein PlAlph_5370 [uncultured Alphaproteobacteria bacterium]
MNIDNLAEVVCSLKDVVRTGWRLREVENPESVADHSYGLCLLTLMLCPEGLDRLKCLEFAIVHDLAESLTGDYVPSDNISPEKKYKMELEAMQDIAARAKCPRLVDLFTAYERRDTPEAVFVKKMDKLDVVLQARYYDMHERSCYFEQKRPWTSLFEEYEGNASPILQGMLDKL